MGLYRSGIEKYHWADNTHLASKSEVDVEDMMYM
jgi:hypothetical protein